MNKIHTITYKDDIIEILHNENLDKKPYLLRFFNFHNERYEIRMDEDDLKDFTKAIDDLFSQDSTVIGN